MPRKPSFFERLTGTVRIDDYDEQEFDDSVSGNEYEDEGDTSNEAVAAYPEQEALSVDVYETPDDIIVKTMCAGVRPEDLDINISREQVTIEGRRAEDTMVNDNNYHVRELYWGSFSRTITLPAEIEPEEAEALEKHGMLIVRLPKIQKDKQTRVKVKSA